MVPGKRDCKPLPVRLLLPGSARARRAEPLHNAQVRKRVQEKEIRFPNGPAGAL